MRRTTAAGTFLFAILLLAGPVAAHEGMGPWIEVVEPQVPSGGVIEVRGDDLERYDAVEASLAADGRKFAMGATRTDADGHFQLLFELPADVPQGTAYVEVRTAAGWAASTWVEIGMSPANDVSQPAAEREPAEAAPWSDPSVIVLAALLIGATGAVGRAVVRSRWAPHLAGAPARRASHPRR